MPAKKKKPKKIENELSLQPLDSTRELTLVESFSQDAIKLTLLEENAALSASVGTLASILDLPYETFDKWLKRGKVEFEQYSGSGVETPHMIIYESFRKGWAKARLLLENAMGAKDPEKALKSKASKLIANDWEEESIEEEEENTTISTGANMIEALKMLRAQGMDLNEIIDNNGLAITQPPEKQEDSVLEKAGLLPSGNVSLPNTLRQRVDG